MNVELGKLTAYLSEPENSRIEELVELINVNINPPTSLKADEVIIRAMYIVSDEINSYGGKFHQDDLNRLVKLIIDSPVLVGHRKDKLPVGRNFHAELVERDGRRWVKSYFYWLKTADGAEHLRENIDGGIYKECSIGFTFAFPECSICAKDIRSCQHEPFQGNPADPDNQKCFFYYRQVDKVLETSLVYRGAVSDTSVTRDLIKDFTFMKKPEKQKIKLSSLDELPDDLKYLVTPNYESVSVTCYQNNGSMELYDDNNNLINPDITQKILADLSLNCHSLTGVLVGYRGKDRCSHSQLMKYFENQKGAVTRVELKLLPSEDFDLNDIITNCKTNLIKIMPHRLVDFCQLAEAVDNISPKEGVMIRPVSQNFEHQAVYYYKPVGNHSKTANSYSFSLNRYDNNGLLTINCDNKKIAYRINQFNINRLSKGSRFMADKLTERKFSQNYTKLVSGNLLKLNQTESGSVYQLDGAITGKLKIYPFLYRP